MTRESKSRVEVAEEQIVETVERTDYNLKDAEIEGTRCDQCGQWFADNEDVNMKEMVEEPTVNMKFQEPFPVEDILENLQAYYPQNTVYETGGKIHPIGLEEAMSTPRAIQQALNDLVERSGGPSREHEDTRTRDVEASLAAPRTLDDPEVFFKLDLDVEIEGDVEHRCEYCSEARE